MNNVLVFSTPDAERISAMRSTLTNARGPTLNRDDALMILYRNGWSASEVAEYGDAAFLACEQFQRTWIDTPRTNA